MSRPYFRTHGGAADYYSPGDYNVICDRTGQKKKASQCRMEWNGLFVRNESWEPRHPQDKIRGVIDDQRVPISRPGGEDVFLGSNEVIADDL